MTAKDTFKVAVVGAGSWGTAVANVFADAGSIVWLWGRDESVLQGINEQHENKKYLKGLPLHSALKGTSDLRTAIAAADLVVCSIPTQEIRKVFFPVADLLPGKILINTSKGIEIGSNVSVSGIFEELSPGVRYGILSGPSFAQEVVQRLPTAITIASADKDIAASVQKRLSTPYFRVYSSTDVVGVETAGALKNVIAIASGMVTGLQLGYNAQAALINRGIAEIARLGAKRGAHPMTFMGLSGVGDLILTCTGPLSRNRRLGCFLGEGLKLEAVQRELGGVAEGAYTARSACELAASLGVEMPIAQEVYGILYEGHSPKKAVTSLMTRDLRDELG